MTVMNAPRFVLHGAVVFVLCVMISGCRVDLYSKQTEADTNEMTAALLANGVDAEKHSSDGGKTWNVQIDEDEIVQAVAVLKSYGLPEERYANLGDMFKKEGLISTPGEERVRFIHGVSQELTETLARIDGVVTARVHIVLPQNDPLSSQVKPSSASVFVKYRPEANLSAMTPAIKNLVSRSVEGLAYDNVSVTLVVGATVQAAKLHSSSALLWWLGGCLIVFLALAGGVFAVLRRRPDLVPPAIARWLPGVRAT